MDWARDLAEVFAFAAELHANQTRKGRPTPYISHLMAVASLVADHGGTSEQVAAALLHDAVEDQGGQSTLDEIARRFGAEVARYVDACTDAHTQPKPPWRGRKEKHVATVCDASPAVKLIVTADKLHNALCITRDLEQDGAALWNRFKGGREGTLWYYRAMRDALGEGWEHPILDEFDSALERLEKAAKATAP